MEGFSCTMAIIEKIITLVLMVIICSALSITPFDSFLAFIGCVVGWAIIEGIVTFVLNLFLLSMIK